MHRIQPARPWGIPLLGLPGVTALSPDPENLAMLLRPFLAAETLEARSADGSFRNTTSGLRLGAVDLLAIRNSGVICQGETTHAVNLVLAVDHPGYWTVDGEERRVLEQPFLLPHCGYTYRAEEVQGLLLSLDPQEVVRVAAAMAGDTSDALRRHLEAKLQRPQPINLEQGRSRHHLQVLHQALWLVDQAARSVQGITPQLALDDLISRMVVLLLCPELDERPEPTALQPLLGAGPDASGNRAQRTINDLVDWMLADLQRPITLTELEARSGYARRTLQKQFQQRFGMGPIQWVRRQRLLQARQMIETSGGKLKLGAIAQACGYHNPASFSRDFHEVFGVRASELTRQARSPTR